MRHLWLLALAVLSAAPTVALGQQYTIRGTDGLTSENFFNFEHGMLAGLSNYFENGVLVSRGGYGQTFTVGTGSTVLSWRMPPSTGCRRFDDFVPATCLFRGYIARFDEGSGLPTEGMPGDVIWSSALTMDQPFSPGPWPMRPNAWLDPGKYMAFLLMETIAPTPTFTGSVWFEYSYMAPIVRGQAPVSPGSDWAMLKTRAPGLDVGETVWQVVDGRIGQGGDLQNFSMTLDSTVTPEPASMALLGTGLAGLLAAAKRRRRRREEAQS